MSEVIPMQKAEFWEAVDKVAGVWRHKVKGGWLVKVANIFEVTMEMPDAKLVGMSRKINKPLNLAIGLTFMPDEKHEWVIE